MEAPLISSGYVIRRVREILGIKQEVLALKLDVSQQRISAIEKQKYIGEPITKQIADALQVPIGTLIKFDEERIRKLFAGDDGGVVSKPTDFLSELNDNKFDANTLIFKIIPLYERLLFLKEKRKGLIIELVRKLSQQNSFDLMSYLLSNQSESLNNRIRKLLSLLNISIEEVSEMSKISISDIDKLEYNSNQSFEVLLKISSFIKVPLFILHNSIDVGRGRVSELKDVQRTYGMELNVNDSCCTSLFKLDDIIKILEVRKLILEEEIDRLEVLF